MDRAAFARFPDPADAGVECGEVKTEKRYKRR
jgi:hypothetical protein